MKTHLTLSWRQTLLLFGLPTLLLYCILTYALPYMRSGLGLHPALSWFIGGTFVFKPMLLIALGLTWWQTRMISWHSLLRSLDVKPLSRRDWTYSLLGLLAIFMGMGGIFGITYILHRYLDVPLPAMTPPALEFPPFEGAERWLLLAWGIMFFFNIVGEELLWRGYILQRQITTLGRWAWLANGALWALFHVPFGFGMVLMASPAFVVVPYVYQQTRNTSAGIVIHGLMNGPIFVAIALGLFDPAAFG